mgnify:CR=1 FL=1
MVKEKLRGYGDRRRELRQLVRMRADLEARMTAPRIQVLTGLPGRSRRPASSMRPFLSLIHI